MVKKIDNTLRHFHTIPECNGRTDICYINYSISRVSMLMRDNKNGWHISDILVFNIKL